MAKSKTIALPANLSPEDALAKVKSQLESEGFGWEQESATEATAYERGKKTSSKSSWNLRMTLTAEPGHLIVTRQTDGAAGYLFPNAGAVTQRLLFNKFHQVFKRLEQTVGS